jgi:uncharacterized membrane protein YeaQ/YmgE (transglycosylase-associated protein family)
LEREPYSDRASTVEAVPIVVVLVAIVLLLIFGGLIVGLTFKLLGLVVTGVIIGALARLLLPGRQAVGLLATFLYGLGGSLLGGILADVFDLGGLVQFILAIAVAALLIALFAGTASSSASRLQ